MPEITLPEVKLPDFKLPEGLRDMSRDDIVSAARDVRMPKMSDLPDFDLSKIELPKQITDRMPNRNRRNPILPIAGLVAVGAAIAAAWWLITSPVTGPRIRNAVKDLKSMMNGEPTDLVRYDNDVDLGSIVSDSSETAENLTATDRFASTNGTGDFGDPVAVGPGETIEGARSN